MLNQFNNLIFSMLMATSSVSQPPYVNIENINQTVCLAQAVFQEASNQPKAGKIAVANVIKNRANSGNYPSDICKVINQKGQFQFVGKTKRIKEDDPMVKQQMIDSATAALLVINNEVPDNTYGAVAFVNMKIATHTDWLHSMKKTTKIGEHTFFVASR